MAEEPRKVPVPPSASNEATTEDKDKAVADSSAGPNVQPGAQEGHDMEQQFNQFGYPNYWNFPPYGLPMYPNPAMMWGPPPPDWNMWPGMGMPPNPYNYQAQKGKGFHCKGGGRWNSSRGGAQGGGKGGTGRGQRGSPGGGNIGGKGRHLQPEMPSESALPMGSKWREDWEKKFKEHTQKDTDEHSQDLEKLLKELENHVWEASQDKEGCHVMQLALKECTTKLWPRLLEELKNKVWEAVDHPHANFVLQTIVEVTNRQSSRFIIEECMERAVDLAKHRYGCRILCRISEHCLGDEQAMKLIEKVLQDDHTVSTLCCHNFGHHVVQQIMEKGSPEHKKAIANVLSTDLMKNAQSRHASYIIEAAFDWCEEEDKKMLREKLLTNTNIVDLAKHQFGGFVVKKLAGQEGEEDEEEQDEDCDEEAEAFEKKMQREVQQTLLKHEAELMKDKNGTKVWNEIFPSRRGQDLSGQEAEDKGPPYSAQGDEGQEICKHK
mmetsp:Transcript_109887/g.218264  ORF Transcript_109887/g.218264 Transcript_109887/m.218264 type:complete len:492 (-) Transcript_109887:397-1872(-)